MLGTPSLARPWKRWLYADDEPANRFNIFSRDGLRLAIHHVPGTRPGPRPAVILLHGLGSNRRVFHFPGRSLAVWLAQRGYDCYLPELRGSGESERPRPDWWIDEYLVQDLPAIIDAVREHSGQDRVHWVGHSLGGLMLLCYGILFPDAPIASGTVIGSALDYRIGHTGFRHLLKVRVLLERLPAIPYGTFMHMISPALGRRGFGWMDEATAWPPNIEPHNIRRIQGTCFHTVPMSLLASLSTLFGRRGLRTRDRTVYFLERAERFTIPLRLVGGTRDFQISANAVRQTANLVSGPAEVCIYGREHGEPEDYGHWDLVVGKRAAREIWPGIGEWLARYTERAAERSA